MTRILALALVLVSTAAIASERPRLRAEVIVRGDVVRIGDVVDNAGIVANIPIFRAPDLGETGKVPAAAIADAVRQHAIVGLDTAGLNEVTVTRASRTIAAKDIEREIARTLAAQYGLGDSAALGLTFDRELRTMHIEPTASQPRVERAAYNSRSGRFDATLEISGMRPLRLSGTAAAMVETVVVAVPVARGQIIKPSDISIERRPRAETAAGVMSAADTVAGLSAKQALRPGQTLRSSDVMKPELVARDAAVTLIYEMPGIMLTVRGKAAESGAEGEMVNVVNLQSKRTVQGVITGPGRVLVSSPLPPQVHAQAQLQAPAPRAVAKLDTSMLNPVLSNALVSAE